MERPGMAARQALECPSGRDQRLIDRVLRQIARGAETAPAGVSSPTRSPR